MRLTQDIKNHLDHYLLLTGGLVAVLVLFVAFRGSELLQQAVIVSAGLLYIAWGIVHHEREGDLHLSIVLEYALMATLAVILVFGIMGNL